MITLKQRVLNCINKEGIYFPDDEKVLSECIGSDEKKNVNWNEDEQNLTKEEIAAIVIAFADPAIKKFKCGS